MREIMAFFHVASAILALGGTFFVVVILAPALRGQSQASETMRAAAKRFAPIVWVCVVLFVLTGLHLFGIRYLAKRADVSSTNWTLILVKIGLSLMIIVHSLLVTLPFKALEGIQQKRLKLLRVNLFIGLAVVAIGVYLVRQHW
ncbi:MAG: hypothetical protein HYR85_21845 [Planctomycetes bacterium]|nr:hypothetical protein [Planctomycetota bacterium]MBI3843866.1 hypothetical protein [Planctomycetota bacterium]